MRDDNPDAYQQHLAPASRARAQDERGQPPAAAPWGAHPASRARAQDESRLGRQVRARFLLPASRARAQDERAVHVSAVILSLSTAFRERFGPPGVPSLLALRFAEA